MTGVQTCALPICYINLCDEWSIFPQTNGTLFNRCSSDMGLIADPQPGMPPQPLNGTCVPFSTPDGTVVPICVDGGTSTTTCDGEATRADPDEDRCAPGSLCLTNGLCGAICNSGLAGEAGTQFGGCDGECFDADPRVDETQVDFTLGLCIATCQMFDEDACPAENGQERFCYPAFTTDPANNRDVELQGECFPQASDTVGPGSACDPIFDGIAPNPCVDGAVCIDVPDGIDDNGICLAFCECETGFDNTTGRCNDDPAPSQCAANETCLIATLRTDRLGFCIDESILVED